MEILTGFKLTDLGSSFKVNAGIVLDGITEKSIQEATFTKVQGTGYIQVDNLYNMYYTKNYNSTHLLIHTVTVQDDEITVALSVPNTQINTEYYINQKVVQDAINGLTIDDINGLDERLLQYIQEQVIEQGSSVTIRLEYKEVIASKITTDYSISKILNIYLDGFGEIDLKDLVYSGNEITLSSLFNTKVMEVLYVSSAEV